MSVNHKCSSCKYIRKLILTKDSDFDYDDPLWCCIEGTNAVDEETGEFIGRDISVFQIEKPDSDGCEFFELNENPLMDAYRIVRESDVIDITDGSKTANALKLILEHIKKELMEIEC